jgi:uncharacterized protein (TIGR00252 family)
MGMSVNKAMNSLAQYYCYYYQQDGRKEIKFDNLTNMVTINEVFGLRNQGRKEEAYEAARVIFATDKSPYASAAMFWTAVDILKIRVSENQMEEARKIHMALERLLPNLKDEKGWMHDAMKKCQALLEKGDKRERLQEEGPEHLKTGIWGEELAAAYLREKGYVILERDWHSKHRDIDIIAQQDGWIVFVEVKTRRSRDFSDPLQAINYQKQKNLRRAINHYINYRKLDNPWRFDVITIVGTIRTKTPEIEHIENFRLNCR